MLIVRNLLTDQLGAPIFPGATFMWLDGASCATGAYVGAEYIPAGSEEPTERVYEIEVLPPTGSGSILTLGEPSYDDIGDRVTQTQTLSYPAIDAVLTARLAELAALRYQKETAGVTVGEAEIGTDREDQGKIVGAMVGFQAGALTSIDWKGLNGFFTYDGAGFAIVAAAVAGHVQECFTREKQLTQALQDARDAPGATPADVVAVDISTGWPE